MRSLPTTLLLTLGCLSAVVAHSGCRTATDGHTHGARAAQHDDLDDDEEHDSRGAQAGKSVTDDDEQLETIVLGAAPAEVRAAIEQLTHGGHVLALERGIQHGSVVYECEYDAGGSPASATFDAGGQVLELERAVDKTALPQPVLDALARHFNGAQIMEAETLEVRYFECVVESAGRRIEVRVSPLGKIEDVE